MTISPALGLVPAPAAEPTRMQVEVVIPVYNEERDLEPSVRRLHDYLSAAFPFTWCITVADNASTDGTPQVATRLAATLPQVRTVRLEQKGRGRALGTVWGRSTAEVVAYMDVDLSTDLAALLPLVAPLLSGHSDLAIGSRLRRDAHVERGPKRSVISKSYNRILHTTLRTHFSDAQCGFKAVRSDRARMLLPHVQDTGWFFDTELLVLAERIGLRIHEVPVDWVDDPDSRVDIVATAMADLRGVARLLRGFATGAIPVRVLRDEVGGRRERVEPPGFLAQVVRFCLVGAASTAAYVVLYVLLRHLIGSQPANALSLLLTAVANTAANRRFSFGVSDGSAARHQLQGLAVFVTALLLTSGSLELLHARDPHPARGTELAVLVAANLGATVLRFVLLRVWVFRRSRVAPASTSRTTPSVSPTTTTPTGSAS